MDDKNYKKLMRRFTILWFLALVLFIVICAIMLNGNQHTGNQLRQYVDDEVELVDERIETLPKPKDGKDGRDGIDGVTTTVERHTTEVITEPGKPGPKGDKGEKGDPGREVEMRINEETRDVETRYKGDDFWQVLIPCTDLLVGCQQ